MPVDTALPASPETAAAAIATPEAAPSPRPHFPALDGYRGIAALLVVFTHVGYQSGFSFRTAFGAPVMRMEIGVTLFFVLSGFLLYRPYAAWHAGAGKRPPTGAFLWNRALRIVPAYWVMLTVVLLTIERDHLTDKIVTSSYLLLQTYQPGLLLNAVGHTWTLCTEASWYAFLPILALLLIRPASRSAHVQRRIELGVVVVFIATGLAYGAVVRGTTLLNPYVAGHWLPHYVSWFGAGMGLAILSVHTRARAAVALRNLAAAPGTCWLAAAAVYGLACTAISGPGVLVALDPWEGAMREALYLGAAVLFLLPGVFGSHDSLISRALSSRVGVFFGNISYAVYLWHFPMLRVVFRWTDTADFSGGFLLNLVVLLAVTLVLATLSWHLVERPALRLKKWRPAVAITAPLRLAAARPPQMDDDRPSRLRIRPRFRPHKTRQPRDVAHQPTSP